MKHDPEKLVEIPINQYIRTISTSHKKVSEKIQYIQYIPFFGHCNYESRQPMELICIRKQLLGTLRCQAQSLHRICQVLRLQNADPEHIQHGPKWFKMIEIC